MANANVKSHGPTLPIKCSLCQHNGLDLIEEQSAFDYRAWILQLFCGSAPVWHIQCSQCQNRTPVPASEVNGMKKLNLAAKNCHAGKTSEDDFYSMVLNSELPCVEDLISHSKQWICSACDSENPPTFEVCWNCNEEHPNPEQLVAVSDKKLSFKQNSVFGY